DADSYDENRHYFLSHFFRDNFEDALATLPQIRSLYKITRTEVWVTNDRNQVENSRDILAIADLGETDEIFNQNPNLQNPPVIVNPDITATQGLPDNSSNPIYDAIISAGAVRNLHHAVATLTSQFRLEPSTASEQAGSRLLRPSEYRIHP